ncbi:MAG: hypothetical protein KDJ31_18260 [Candidatus Competibacteraceae bacterium]|nr:hypothetical protein [Candidatus Competibacteraceae bacterium]MCP5451294.1 hypothetical protein [Gammaproteobacteria bacterium]
MTKDRFAFLTHRSNEPNLLKKSKNYLPFIRYLQDRRDDLCGRSDRRETINHWIDTLLRAANQETPPADVSANPVEMNSVPLNQKPSRRWPTEALPRQEQTAIDRRRQYDAEASWVRAFLLGAVMSVLVCMHRLWLNDGAGAGASLGAGFTFLALSLPAAHRCWQMRHHTLVSPRQFLRHPSDWWPSRLPDDDPP